MAATTTSTPVRLRRVRRPTAVARLLLPLLVLVVVLLPGLTAGCAPGPAACTGADCAGGLPLDLPACGEIPGLDTAPEPLTPLAGPSLPSLPASRAGTLPGAGTLTPAGEYQYRIPLDVPPGRAGMQPALGDRGSGG